MRKARLVVMARRCAIGVLAVLLGLAGIWLLIPTLRAQEAAFQGAALPPKPRDVAQVMAWLEPRVAAGWQQTWQAAGLRASPRKLALLAFKQERQLEVWAWQGSRWVWLRSYPVLAASGQAGPKLREGDRQVPEGVYRLAGMNPNSAFHLSMKINYPNAYDRQQAARERRTRLGGDIFIHGSSVSIGCLALGDAAIEELFYLVQQVGFEQVEVVLAPHDLRRLPPPAQPRPAWVATLYAGLQGHLRDFPVRDVAPLGPRSEPALLPGDAAPPPGDAAVPGPQREVVPESGS